MHYLDKPPQYRACGSEVEPGVQFSMTKGVQFPTSVDTPPPSPRTGKFYPMQAPAPRLFFSVSLSNIFR